MYASTETIRSAGWRCRTPPKIRSASGPAISILVIITSVMKACAAGEAVLAREAEADVQPGRIPQSTSASQTGFHSASHQWPDGGSAG